MSTTTTTSPAIKGPDGEAAARAEGPSAPALLVRERTLLHEVLRLVAEGKTSKEIAVMLNLGLQTVRSYRKTMMKKLGVNNVAGLTQRALAAGAIPMIHPPADEFMHPINHCSRPAGP